jgi:hypothetical protein
MQWATTRCMAVLIDRVVAGSFFGFSGSFFLLNMFSQPQIYQCLGRDSTSTSPGFDLCVDFRINRDPSSPFGPNFELSFMGLVPVVCQTVPIPKFSNLIQALRF